MDTTESRSTVWTPQAKRAFVVWCAVVAILDGIFLNLFVRTADLKDASVVDRTSISLNALGLAFVLATLIVGALAVVGWQKLEETIRRDVEESNRGRLEALELQMKGRVTSVAGYALGELSSRADQLEPTNRELLSQAVGTCRAGYDLLKKSGDRRATLFGLNNFVYYASISQEDELEGLSLLGHARTLREEGTRLAFAPYLLTFCRAVLHYSRDPSEVGQAKAIASQLLASKLTDQEKAEAGFYLSKLSAKLALIDGSGSQRSPQ